MNLVNQHGHKLKRCHGPNSSGFLGHLLRVKNGLRRRLVEEHRMKCLESTGCGSMRFYSRNPVVQNCKSCNFLVLFHYKILFPNISKLPRTGKNRVIKRKAKDEHALLVSSFQSKPSMK